MFPRALFLLLVVCACPARAAELSAAASARAGQGTGTRFEAELPLDAAAAAAELFLRDSSFARLESAPDALHAGSGDGRRAVSVYLSSSSAGGRAFVEVVYRENPGPLYLHDDQRAIEETLARGLDGAMRRAWPSARGRVAGPELGALPEGRVRPMDAAIVIGVQNYRDLSPVPTAGRDARAFREVALSALGVPDDRVLMLDGDVVLQGDLRDALERWLPARVSTGTRVYFYYSGHGARGRDGRAYLLGWDAHPDDPGRGALPVSQILEDLLPPGASASVVFIDACAVGTADVFAAPSSSGSVAFFSAAADGRLAETSLERGQGVFTYRVVGGLRGAARGPGGRVTAGSLGRYLAAAVSKDTDGRQSPVFSGDENLLLFDPRKL